MEHRQILQALVGIARRAGEAILGVYGQEFEVMVKEDASPLTRADLASHRVICAALADLDPGTPVLSEESADVPRDTRRAWSRYWLVDPLDGTREFIKRNGEFTVNIALVEDCYPVLGVVHAPVSDVTYFGSVGSGCFRQDEAGSPRPVGVRIPTARPPVVVGSRSHADPGLAARLNRIGPHRLISMGSSLKFCRIAEGAADLYPRFGPTSEWDTAAAQAVVEAAGGRVETLNGERLRYNDKPDFRNPEFLVYGDASAGWPERLATKS
jgi:3'(2'), 5'-bisphosphate nucleotidase